MTPSPVFRTISEQIVQQLRHDVLSGRLRRAPGWMRTFHLEWLYRLVQEPWRWKRMFTALPTFAILALAAERGERYTGAGEHDPTIGGNGQQPGVQQLGVQEPGIQEPGVQEE